MVLPLPEVPEDEAGVPLSRAERARGERLRQAVAAAQADRELLAQGLPPADDPRWEGDPFGDGVVVEEYDERQFRLWALQDELRSAEAAAEVAPADEAARERVREAQRALGVFRCEDDLPFSDGGWRLDLARFREAGREASRQLAEDAHLLAGLARRVPRVLGDTRGASAWTSFLQELAVARSWSTRAAAAQVEQALVLTEDLPRVHGAVGSGLLAVAAARKVVEVAAGASVGLRGAVDAVALEVVGLPAWRAEQVALKALLRADPEAAARRAARGARERGVALRPMTDQRVEISVVGPAVAGLQAYAALDADARALRRAGDPRTLAQLRFDLFVERAVAGHVLPDETPDETPDDVPDEAMTTSAVAAGSVEPAVEPAEVPEAPAPRSPADAWTGLFDEDDDEPLGDPCAPPEAPPPVPPDPTLPGWLLDRRFGRSVRIEITVPVTTARGLDDEPGWLSGYGWISAPSVRQLLPAAELRQVCVVAAGQQGAGTVVDRGTTLRRPEPTPAGVTAELERMMTEPFPVSGAAWQPQSQHDPTPALADLVRTRDRYDDGPVLPQVRADRADLDHEQPWRPEDNGGPTAAWNLVSRGQRTHGLKHRGWDPTRTADGTLWRSPAGQVAFSPRWADPPPSLRTTELPDPHDVAARDRDLLRPRDDDLA